MPLGRYAVEAVAVALYLVSQRECRHGQVLGTVDRLRFSALHRIEHDLIAHSLTEERFVELQHRTEGLGTVDIQVGGPAVQGHGTEQAEQAEHMVAVYVRYEHGLDLEERHACLAQLLLGTLAAVDKEEAPLGA